MTLNSPSGSTLQCDTWFWDDMPLTSPKRPPYWNSSYGFDFGHITAVDISFCTSLQNFIKIGPPSTEKNDMSIFKMADLGHLGFWGPIMGSFKSPRTTFYRSSMVTDRQTDKQTDKQMDNANALSRSRCREWQLKKVKTFLCKMYVMLICERAIWLLPPTLSCWVSTEHWALTVMSSQVTHLQLTCHVLSNAEWAEWWCRWVAAQPSQPAGRLLYWCEEVSLSFDSTAQHW